MIFSTELDYAPLPNESTEVDGLSFIPLRSCEALYVEGAAMRHCVASYSGHVVQGRSRIFSVREGERRVATVELNRIPDGSFRVVQSKGPCNTRLTKAVQATIGSFERDYARLPSPTPPSPPR